jgi:hypothetical protein
VVLLWGQDETVEGELLCIHVDLEDVGGVTQAGQLEDDSAALFCSVFFEFLECFLLFLGFGEFAFRVGL